MRYIPPILIIALFIACNFHQTKNADGNSTMEYHLPIDSAKIAQIRLTNPADYHRVLDTIDPGDLVSLEIASILFKNCVADTLTRDSMFVVLEDFMNHLAGSYLENNEQVNNQLANKPSPQIFNSLQHMFAAHGMILQSAEGSFFLEPQSAFLLQNFGSGLSPAYREFLTIESREQQEFFARDGKILIPTDSLISRIITWDRFMEHYPGFVSIRSAQDKYAQYLGVFLSGMEGSRVFDPETNILNDSSKISFELMVEKYPESRSSEVVKGYLDLLKSADFMYTQKVDSFLLQKVYEADHFDSAQ